MGFLGRDVSLPNELGVCRSAVSFPSGLRGEALATWQRFRTFYRPRELRLVWI